MTFDEVSDNNRKILVRVLESIPKRKKSENFDDKEDAHTANLIKLRDTYESCLDTVSSTSRNYDADLRTLWMTSVSLLSLNSFTM